MFSSVLDSSLLNIYDPQQIGNLHFQYKTQPAMLHKASCKYNNTLNLSIMEPDGSKLLIQNFTSRSNLCHLNPNHMTINCLLKNNFNILLHLLPGSSK